MVGKTITYFLWDDVKKEVCNILGITTDLFTNYKPKNYIHVNLWALYLEYYDLQVRPGEIVPVNSDAYDLEFMLHLVRKDNNHWLEPFILAFHSVITTYYIKYIKYP